jgi:hypothetical protein
VAYTINLTNGTSLIPAGLGDGEVDTSFTSLVLIGKSYAGYGQFLNTNFVRLLENFANRSSPSNPLKGQLWWDTNNNILKVYSGTSWKVSTGATSSPFNSPPTDLSALGGDLWLDSTNGQLKVYNGSSWITVGPVGTSAAGDTGLFPVIVSDTFGGSHLIIQVRFSGINYACFSKDIFTSNLTGFTTIKAGLNFNTSVSPTQGISTQDVAAAPNSLVMRDGSSGITVAGVSATTVQATTASITSITGNITVPAGGSFASSGYSTYNGFELATVGGATTFTALNNTIIGNSTPSTGKFTSIVVTGLDGLQFSAGDVYPTSNTGGNIGKTTSYVNNVNTKAINVLTSISPASNLGAVLGSSSSYFNNSYILNSYSGNVYAGGVYAGNVNLTSTGVAPSANLAANIGSTSTYFNNAYVNNIITLNGIVPSANLGANIGSATNSFNIVFGKAVQAQYADLAERFEADAEYEPGTVVEIGGPLEITAASKELSENVFGVISTNAAYLMNAGAGTDQTHPPVAVQGRVPVKVIGRINKGDRLVSAGNGIARAGKRSEITSWNVIGRSLENKTTDGAGVIEAVVKINS